MDNKTNQNVVGEVVDRLLGRQTLQMFISLLIGYGFKCDKVIPVDTIFFDYLPIGNYAFVVLTVKNPELYITGGMFVCNTALAEEYFVSAAQLEAILSQHGIPKN